MFILPDGNKISKIANVIRFMEHELSVSIPSATEVRKIGSTGVARHCTEGEARVVARQMSHDPRVSAQYYQAIRGAKDAKTAFPTVLNRIHQSYGMTRVQTLSKKSLKIT